MISTHDASWEIITKLHKIARVLGHQVVAQGIILDTDGDEINRLSEKLVKLGEECVVGREMLIRTNGVSEPLTFLTKRWADQGIYNQFLHLRAMSLQTLVECAKIFDYKDVFGDSKNPASRELLNLKKEVEVSLTEISTFLQEG